jgi:hypothetical protein
MPVHDWTRVHAGIFHDFHSAWVIHLKESLNGGVLPPDYYAIAEQRAGQVSPDELTLRSGDQDLASSRSKSPIAAVAEAPPKVSLMLRPQAREDALKRRTLTIRHTGDDRIIALVEIVSPANKDRRSSVEEFADKAISSLKQGYHLLVVDLLPPGRHDPQGMHGATWKKIDEDQPYQVAPEKPLTMASYAADLIPSAYVEPVALGAALPDMPLFLDPRWYVPTPLEKTYCEAFSGVPERWRSVIEGR